MRDPITSHEFEKSLAAANGGPPGVPSPAVDSPRTWYGERAGGELGCRERDAARKAAVHAGTPAVAHFDTLGRPFLTIAHNRFLRDGTAVEERLATHVVTDVEGNQREVVDAKQRSVMRYGYDLLGHRIRQASQEAGERRMLQDVTGKPIYLWDSRGHAVRTTYDALRRPVDVFLREGDGPEKVIGRMIYGDSLPDPEPANLRGKVHQVFDTAGLVTSERYDFKGNAIDTRRQLAEDYKQTPDWSASPALEAETFVGHTVHDALNRPIQIVAPHAAGAEDGHSAVLQAAYNEAGLLETLDVWPRFAGEPAELLDGAEAELHAIRNLDYNAKGQRTRIEYGNGARTDYDYDPKTFRLLRLRTLRGEHALQDLSYTFDPVGNITDLRDDAQKTIFFRNRAVEPNAGYTYDALYRLIEATGREHLGQGGGPEPTSPTDAPRVGLPQPGDGDAMGRYLERYVYDEVGNFLQMIHRGSNPSRPGWTRAYRYDEPSQLEPDRVSNRLTSTAIGNHAAESYAYDAHGNMTAMPHLSSMQWDFKDQLQAVARQATGDGITPETTYYVYNATGQRVRKVTERSHSTLRSKERLYLGGFEVYREYEGDGCTVSLERETLHVMDGQQRIALIETRTQGSDPAPAQLIRYQLSNHLGSATLELDARAQIISYEEYYPYGSTSYQAVRSRTETPKRYRYTGKERDEESGLYYHGARYYAPWLTRWTSADQAGLIDGTNVYAYVCNNPMRFVDPDGRETKQQQWEREFRREYPYLEGVGRVQGTFDEGVLTETGVRVSLYAGDFLAPRQFYERKDAAFLAYQGFVHYAELVEAGHDATAFQIGLEFYHRTGRQAPRDTELDLDAYTGWSRRAVASRQGTELGLLVAQVALTVSALAEALTLPRSPSPQTPPLPRGSANGVPTESASGEFTAAKPAKRTPGTDSRVQPTRDAKSWPSRTVRVDRSVDPGRRPAIPAKAKRIIQQRPAADETGPFDYGHKPGHEAWRMQKKVRGGEIEHADFKRAQQDPDIYQFENRSINRGHSREQKR
ncbi:MAG TPA: RHS repeat-associated core domain-containing protein [Thermoanaerobaculia bacterium]|jgi:RHS repeat-associated protein